MDAKKRRNRDEYAVIPVTESIEKGMSGYPYDDHLELAGLVADRFAQMGMPLPKPGSPGQQIHRGAT